MAAPPGLSCLEGDGQRFLFCSFCWHKWPLQRALCPLCGNRDQEHRLFLYSDEEPEYRVDACASCRKYIKTVDTRVLGRRSYPPLEQIASLHLDIKASEAGYTAGIPITPDDVFRRLRFSTALPYDQGTRFERGLERINRRGNR